MTGQTVREVSTGVSVKAFRGFRIERKVVIVIGLGDGVDKWGRNEGFGPREVWRHCGLAQRGVGRSVDSVVGRIEDPQAGRFLTQAGGHAQDELGRSVHKRSTSGDDRTFA